MTALVAALGMLLAALAGATLLTKRDHWSEYLWAIVSLVIGIAAAVVALAERS